MSKTRYSPSVEIDIVEEHGSHRVTVTCSSHDFNEMNGRGWPVENGGSFPTRQLAETEASRIASSVEQYKGSAVKRWLNRR